MGKDVSNLAPYDVKVISNIVTSQFNEILEFVLRSHLINARVSSGDYDNILQDSLKFASSNAVIVFWELCNLVDGLQYKAATMGEYEIENLIEKTKNELDFLFKNLENCPNVIFNKFSSLVFNHSFLTEDAFDRIGNTLNAYVDKNLPGNFTLINIDKVFGKLSIEKSIDLRYFYSSKALYSLEFYKEYSNFILPIVLSLTGKTKKVFIFDCDNTLWKGIVGEDGVDGIILSAKDKNGNIFEEVHHLIHTLSAHGVLIGLCSKNNQEDVDEVFLKRGDFALRSDDIAIKRINWNDKVSNLRDMASELNVGIDSFVFIDDSPFELDYVRKNLPEVVALEVGENLYNYPLKLRETYGLFYKRNYTKEDKERASLYKTEESRKSERNKFASLDQYLSSLQLKVNIYKNDISTAVRAAQLTQKTNQFNFTTHRYTEAEIEQFIKSEKYNVYVFGVVDKFGDYGITGLAIIDFENKSAIINNLLMSCRVIGRNIEIAFLNFIVKDLRGLGIERINSSYIGTAKNEQVRSFYEDFGFNVEFELDKEKKYSLILKDYKDKTVDYITINN